MEGLDLRKILEALGAALITFLTGIALFKSFHDLNADTLFEPTIQSLLMFISTLGIRSFSAGNPPKP